MIFQTLGERKIVFQLELGSEFMKFDLHCKGGTFSFLVGGQMGVADPSVAVLDSSRTWLCVPPCRRCDTKSVDCCH